MVRMPIPLLITAFEPGDGRTSNASMRVVAPLRAHAPDGVEVRVLPADPTTLRRTIPDLVRRLDPQRWLLLGEAETSLELRCERIARNYVERDEDDRTGRAVRGAPEAYFTTLDPVRLEAHFEGRGLRTVVSEDAGTGLANLALFLALHQVRRNVPGAEVGFVHVPRHYRRMGLRLADLREALGELIVSLRDGGTGRRPRRVKRTSTPRPS